MTLKLYASPEYLEKYGEPKSVDDLKNHQLVAFSQAKNSYFTDLDWHLSLGQKEGEKRSPILRISDPIYSATEGKGIGIVTLGDKNILLKKKKLVNILPELTGPTINVYYAYSEHFKGIKSIKNFSEFLANLIKSEYSQP